MNFDAMKRRQFLQTSAATAGTLLAGGLDVKPRMGGLSRSQH